MDLGEQAHRVKFMIRHRGPDFTTAFDTILAGGGIRTVLCNVRTPRMNAIAERWIGGCRPRAPGPHPRLEPEPPAADPAPVRDPPQSAPASPLPARRHAAETATRTGRSRPVPRPQTGSRRRHDQRISPGRVTRTRFSARTLAERPKPDSKLAPRGRIGVAIAQERGEGGQFPDVTQDGVPVPGSDALPVGRDECVALVFWESEPGRLQCWDQIDSRGLALRRTWSGPLGRARWQPGSRPREGDEGPSA